MAILQDLGLKVTVVINGQEAPEHDDPDAEEIAKKFSEETNVCCKYVESVEDAEFEVKVDVLPSYNWDQPRKHDLELFLEVDSSESVHGILIDRNWPSSTISGHEVVQSGQLQGLQKFRFSHITTTDDASKEKVQRDSKKAEKLGLLLVRIRRVLKKGLVTGRDRPIKDTSQLNVSEKALKGKSVSHSTSYSSMTPSDYKITYRKVEHFDPAPLVVFYLRYRSRDDLIRHMIVSRPATPPTPRIGVESLPHEELVRLARERLEMLEEIKADRAIKREAKAVFDLTGDDEALRSGRPAKLVKLEDGQEAIDLTDD